MKASRLLRVLARWHRWVGLAATLFIVWLAISGVLIHHAADFGLEGSPVRSAWILDHYRIGEPETRSFKAGEHWISQAGKSLYFDRERIAGFSEPLVGAVHLPGLLVVASHGQLTLLDERGRPMETLRVEHGLPPAIRAVGLRGNRIVLETDGGLFEADPDELQWRPGRGVLPRATPGEPPAALQSAIVRDARAREISRERLLRDLHSGNFFGAAGRWAIDLAALALVVLATTGIWIWLRVRREFGAAKTAKADKERGKLSR